MNSVFLLLDRARSLGRSDASVVGVAGVAASGKTELLARLADAYMDSLKPEEILVLWPSRLGAFELNNRLVIELLGKRGGISGRLVKTLSAFSYELIRDYFQKERRPGPRFLSVAEQDVILAEVLFFLRRGSEEFLAGFNLESELLRGQIIDFLGNCMRVNLTPKKLTAIAEGLGESDLAKLWRAMAEVMDRYWAVRGLSGGNSFSSVELIKYAARLLSTGRVRVGLRQILVDEAQELTLEGLEFLAAAARQGIGIKLFGDPDRTVTPPASLIPGCMGNLATYFGPSSQLVVLDRVWGSWPRASQIRQKITSHIGSGALVLHRQPKLIDGLQDENVRSEPRIAKFMASSWAEEFRTLAFWLRQRRVFGGMTWGEMAVILPNRELVERARLALVTAGVPAAALGGSQSLASSPGSGLVLNFLKLVMEGARPDFESLKELLLSPLGGLDPLSLRRLMLYLRSVFSDLDYPNAARALTGVFEGLLVEEDQGLEGLDSQSFCLANLVALAKLMRRARAEFLADQDLAQLVWLVWDEGGLGRLCQSRVLAGGFWAETAREWMANFKTLQRVVDSWQEKEPLVAGRVFLRRLLDSSLPTDNLGLSRPQDRVILLTPGTSVGERYRAVAIAALQDNLWSASPILGDVFEFGYLLARLEGLGRSEYERSARQAALHESLRMLLQSFTRSSEEILLTATEAEDQTPSRFMSVFFEDLPCIPAAEHNLTLVGEITRYRARLERDAEDLASASALKFLANSGLAYAHPNAWYGARTPSTPEFESSELDKSDCLSVAPSSLDSYRRCPLSWALQFIGASEYRGNSAQLGTLLHAVLKELTDANHTPSAELMWSKFLERLGEVEFRADWLRDLQKARLRRVIERIVDYLQDFSRRSGRLLGAEVGFEFCRRLPSGCVRFRGSIDRLEFIDNRVRVVDLKTGASVLSKAEAGENLQLALYQLALRLDPKILAELEDCEPDRIAGAGAMLLYPGVSAQKAAKRVKSALEDQELERMDELLDSLVRAVRRGRVSANIDLHCRGVFGGKDCLKHTVAEVSWRPGEASR